MPKIKAFTMPKWGIEMTEGQVAEWNVKENDPFTKGTLLALIETEKITNEVEAEKDGRFARIVAQKGETYPVGALLAVEADDDVDSSQIDDFISNFKGVDHEEKDEETSMLDTNTTNDYS